MGPDHRRAASMTIRWLVERGSADLDLIWIDDQFFPAQQPPPGEFAVDEKWLAFWVDDETRTPKMDNPARQLRRLRSICADLGVGFGITSFRDALTWESVGERVLLLIDVANAYADNERPIDGDALEWSDDLFGVAFASSRKLTKDHFRFFTRWGSLENRFGTLPDRFANKFPASLFLSREDFEDIARWIEAFTDPIQSVLRLVLELSVAPLDPIHSKLHDALGDAGSAASQLINDWCGIDIGADARKALFLVESLSDVGPGRRDGRTFATGVLRSVLERLRMNVDVRVTGNCALPTSAGILFLVGLADLLHRLRHDPKYPPCSGVSLGCSPAVYDQIDRYAIQILLSESAPRWGLSEVSLRARGATTSGLATRNTEASRTTGGALLALVQGRLYGRAENVEKLAASVRAAKDVAADESLSQKLEEQKQLILTGVDYPVVGVTFEPNALYLLWHTQRH